MRHAVLSRSARFGFGRKDVGIKALLCVGGEPLGQILGMARNSIILVTLFLATLTTKLSGQERNNLSVDEIKEVIQLAIDLPKLQPFFHVDIDTTRLPITFKTFGLINADNLGDMQKFGQPLRFLDGAELEKEKVKSYFNVGDWTYHNDNLRLQLEYSIEGVMINYMFVRIDGIWQVENSVIMEQ